MVTPIHSRSFGGFVSLHFQYAMCLPCFWDEVWNSASTFQHMSAYPCQNSHPLKATKNIHHRWRIQSATEACCSVIIKIVLYTSPPFPYNCPTSDFLLLSHLLTDSSWFTFLLHFLWIHSHCLELLTHFTPSFPLSSCSIISSVKPLPHNLNLFLQHCYHHNT